MARFVCRPSLCIIVLFMIIIILISHRQAAAQPEFRFISCSDVSGNYNENSTYKANLDQLLSTLTTAHQIDYGFYNFSYGENQNDKAYAIGLCRGDVTPDACRSCLNNSEIMLPRGCPNQKEAIGWYDECMLRYSDRSIFGFKEDTPTFFAWNINNASNPDRHIQVARNLLQYLIGFAASGDSRRKFASGNVSADPDLPTIYGTVQCTPDLSQKICNDCLVDALRGIGSCCQGRQGGRVVGPSCYFTESPYSVPVPTSLADPPLLLPPSPPPLTSNTTTQIQENEERGKSRVTAIIAVPIFVGVVTILLTIISICMFLRKRRLENRATMTTTISPTEDEITNVESLQFKLNTIRIATNEFSDENKLGQGGFGAVYKGRLPNGKEIAVKRLSRVSSQGDVEFKNEIVLVANLQHRNLVQLLGFCFEGNEKLLIYEFVQNSSLEKIIFDPLKRASLDWESRYKIIIGIARGLVYLHEDSRLRIIHRDLKASNILLDAQMNAKISDFGTAKLFAFDQTQGDTSRIVGTYGYMAPEYVMRGQFSIKSDVFSFGVLVLEIVSGQKNNSCVHGSAEDSEDLINYVWRNWREGNIIKITDPSIQSGSRIEMARCIHIGLLCIQEDISKRPTMADVVIMLNSHSMTIPRPSQPAFFMSSSTYSSKVAAGQWRTGDLDSSVTNSDETIHSKKESFNDATITEPYPR